MLPSRNLGIMIWCPLKCGWPHLILQVFWNPVLTTVDLAFACSQEFPSSDILSYPEIRPFESHSTLRTSLYPVACGAHGPEDLNYVFHIPGWSVSDLLRPLSCLFTQTASSVSTCWPQHLLTQGLLREHWGFLGLHRGKQGISSRWSVLQST